MDNVLGQIQKELYSLEDIITPGGRVPKSQDFFPPSTLADPREVRTMKGNHSFSKDGLSASWLVAPTIPPF